MAKRWIDYCPSRIFVYDPNKESIKMRQEFPGCWVVDEPLTHEIDWITSKPFLMEEEAFNEANRGQYKYEEFLDK